MKLDEMEFGRRLAVERELVERNMEYAKKECAIFDETGNFILYPSLVGVKVVNVITNKLVRILGKEENHRFLDVKMYQAAPQKKGLQTIVSTFCVSPTVRKGSDGC
jgi:peptidylprolyl isomerase domain and WD repeat-containing protein 1